MVILFWFVLMLVALYFTGVYLLQLLLMPAFWAILAIILLVNWLGWTGFFILVGVICFGLVCIWAHYEG